MGRGGHQIAHHADHALHIIGFGKEPHSIRQLIRTDENVAGGDDDRDPRPALSDPAGQLQAIHRPRHPNIGEEHVDCLGIGLAYGKSVNSGAGLDRHEPLAGQGFDGERAKYRLVFGHQHNHG
jgi:hypothetical protein